MTYVQSAPFSIQVEPTEGCNLRCGFCGIRGIREKGTSGALSGPYSYMAVDTAHALARQVAAAGWSSRIEFAMHGEPTMNPDLPAIISAFRSRLPKQSIMVTTNGIPLLDRGLRASILALINAGANTIAIDDYAPHRVAPTVRGERWPFPVMEYPADKHGNPHVRFSGQRIVIVEDIAQAETGTHSTLNNHAGSAAPPNTKRQAQVCTLPFREMSVRYNGQVALCCNDWRGQYPIGDAAADLLAVWNSPQFMAARRILLAEGRKDITPCAGCDYRGTRVGLLPLQDGSGRAELGEPTEADRKMVADQAGTTTLAPVVLRRWEK